jgi:serine/threonine protein phosphatase 1
VTASSSNGAGSPGGRVLAIGDIHGCSRALDVLLAQVRPAAADVVVGLGDFVDRGPDSAGVLDRLLDLQTRCRLVALRGNHEEMMLAAHDGTVSAEYWVACGGRQTLASYPAVGEGAERIPRRHWEFLESTIDYYETQTHFFVHAGVYADLPLDEQPNYMLRWEPLLEEPGQRRHVSGKVMVCGHTSQRSGEPLNLGWAVCIDTWAYGRGWLTCLEPRTGRVWQANQGGEQRSGWLPEAKE